MANNWASEASPTLGCSIEISRDICNSASEAKLTNRREKKFEKFKTRKMVPIYTGRAVLGSVYNYISNIGLSDQVFILMNT